MDKFRQIVRNPRFEQDLNQLIFDAVRADEFTEGCEFILSRDPGRGTRVSNSVWFLPMWRPGDGKRVNLYYTYNQDSVFFLALKPAPEESEE